MCSLTSWLTAQTLKFLIHWRIHHRADWRRFFGMGGMPSSHTAFFISLTFMTGLIEGVGSTAFAITVGVASVVIYDAMGVRYQTGKQNRVINRILHEMFVEGKGLTEEKLQELMGHTPLEVIFGALIGLLIPLLFQ